MGPPSAMPLPVIMATTGQPASARVWYVGGSSPFLMLSYMRRMIWP